MCSRGCRDCNTPTGDRMIEAGPGHYQICYIARSSNLGQGMKSIFWGAVIIAIGLVRGDSVLRGAFNVVSIFFDALGVFFSIRGLVPLYQPKRQQAAVSPVATPPR